MTKESRQSEETSSFMTENSFLWFASLWIRARRYVFLTCVVTAFVSGVISFLLPKWYAGTTTILPPRETGLLSSLGSLGTALKEFAPLRSIGGIGGMRGGPYNYLSILDSRRAKEALIKKFDLIRVYDISDMSVEKTIRALEENLEIDVASIVAAIATTIFITIRIIQ